MSTIQIIMLIGGGLLLLSNFADKNGQLDFSKLLSFFKPSTPTPTPSPTVVVSSTATTTSRIVAQWDGVRAMCKELDMPDQLSNLDKMFLEILKAVSDKDTQKE